MIQSTKTKKSIYSCIESGDINEVTSLLKAGASITKKNTEGKTPIQQAAKAKNWAMVECILKHGKGNDDADTAAFGYALMAASANGQEELAIKLFKAGAGLKWSRQNKTAIDFAIENNLQNLMTTMAAELRVPSQLRLKLAILLNNVEIVETFSKAELAYALTQAAKDRQEELAIKLFKAGASEYVEVSEKETAIGVVTEHKTAIDFAIEHNLQNLMTTMMAEEVRFSSQVRLKLAILLNNVEIVETILKAGQLIHTKYNGETPLELADKNRNLLMLKCIFTHSKDGPKIPVDKQGAFYQMAMQQGIFHAMLELASEYKSSKSEQDYIIAAILLRHLLSAQRERGLQELENLKKLSKKSTTLSNECRITLGYHFAAADEKRIDSIVSFLKTNCSAITDFLKDNLLSKAEKDDILTQLDESSKLTLTFFRRQISYFSQHASYFSDHIVEKLHEMKTEALTTTTPPLIRFSTLQSRLSFTIAEQYFMPLMLQLSKKNTPISQEAAVLLCNEEELVTLIKARYVDKQGAFYPMAMQQGIFDAKLELASEYKFSQSEQSYIIVAILLRHLLIVRRERGSQELENLKKSSKKSKLSNECRITLGYHFAAADEERIDSIVSFLKTNCSAITDFLKDNLLSKAEKDCILTQLDESSKLTPTFFRRPISYFSQHASYFSDHIVEKLHEMKTEALTTTTPPIISFSTLQFRLSFTIAEPYFMPLMLQLYKKNTPISQEAAVLLCNEEEDELVTLNPTSALFKTRKLDCPLISMGV